MLQSPTLAINEGKALAPLLEQAGNAASQWLKQQLCSGGGFLLDNLPAIGPGGRAAREVARGIHGGICGLPTPPELGEPTPGVPPFTGGQCECAFYTVNYTLTRKNPPQTLPGSFTRRGPISGPINGGTVPENPNRKSWGFYYGAAGCGGRLFEILASGGPNEASDTFSVTITGVVRQGGQPDNCGSLPPGPPTPPPPAPPVPTPPDIDLPVTPPGGGPDVDFTFSPRTGPIFIGVGGALIVPVNVRVGGPNINVNAPISIPVNISLPDFNISFPGQGGGGGAPDDPAAPIPPGPPPRPVPGPPREVCCDPPLIPGPVITDDEPNLPPPSVQGLRFVGILVRSTIAPGQGNFTVVGQGGGDKNLFLPRLANIYFDVRVNNQAGVGQPGTVGPIPVQLLRQYIPVPEGISSINWRVVREPGVTTTVIPLFVPAQRQVV
jgi:hypothetical protein